MKRILLSVSILTMLLVGCEESELNDFGLTIEEPTEEELKQEEEQILGVVTEPVEDNMEDRYYFLTSEEEEYLELVGSITNIQTETLNNLVYLIGESRADYSSKNEYSKEIELAYIKSEMSLKLLNEVTESNSVPKIFNEVNPHLVKLVENVIASKPHFIKGVKESNDEFIAQGQEALYKAIDEGEELQAVLDEVLKVYQ